MHLRLGGIVNNLRKLIFLSCFYLINLHHRVLVEQHHISWKQICMLAARSLKTLPCAPEVFMLWVLPSLWL